MREILFRGKRCDNGEWAQGYYIRADYHWHKYGIHKDWIALGASANGGWFALRSKYAVKSETVGQYTGLTDKNGKKIFEGDIVKCEDSKHACQIIWNDTFSGYCCCRCSTLYDFTYDDLPEDYEVIGNIHDNPELLKGDNDA